MFSLIKKYFSKMAVIIIIGLAAICFYQHTKVKLLGKELDTVTNNCMFYLSKTSAYEQLNIVLQLEVDELNNSNDSLIQHISEVKQQLNIKDKVLKSTQVINTIIKDTVLVTIEPDKLNFTEELKLNNLTTITVSKLDSILSAVLDLKNQQTLFVTEQKVYKNSYKNWFQRLIHFDFRKRKLKNYQIENSNDLIEVTDTRVIEII